MGDNSLITRNQLQSDLENFYNTKVYPYLNGSAKLGFTPIGTVISVMSNEAPENYLVCDGTTYNIQDYSDLANFFEEQFGSKNYFGGDGTTTFAVPDLRGEFLRGTGTNSHTNQGSGANVGVHQDGTEHIRLTVDNLGAIYYSCPAPEDLTNSDYLNESGVSSDNRASYNGSSTKYTSQDQRNTFTSRPTNTSVLYCIAYKNIYFEQRHEYSTEEHVVGTWIDGKPLYEKTFEGTTPDTPNVNQAYNTMALPSGYNIKNIFGAINSEWQINTSYTDGNTISIISTVWFGGSGQLIVRMGRERECSKNFNVTVQYTKTTD